LLTLLNELGTVLYFLKRVCIRLILFFFKCVLKFTSEALCALSFLC